MVTPIFVEFVLAGKCALGGAELTGF